jgi:hypothetical protein
VLVTRVAENTGASRAGLRAGDVVLRVDGEAVRRVEDLHSVLGRHQSGDRVEVVVRRRDREERLQVEVAAMAMSPLPGRLPGLQQPGTDFDDEARDLRREMRELQRRVDELERELRTLRRR